MSYRIERLDGSIDGLGDEVVFPSWDTAASAAEQAFGRDPASDGPDGIWAWLRVVEVEEPDGTWCATDSEGGDVVSLPWATSALEAAQDYAWAGDNGEEKTSNIRVWRRLPDGSQIDEQWIEVES